MATERSEEELRVEKTPNPRTPERILLFSGKRKSGKDYITDVLHQRLGPDRSTIIKISGPIKVHWARNSGLDLDQLLGDGEYKEKYRLQMVEWSENVRKQDYGYFCRNAIDMYNAWEKPIWIVSDIRRKTDIKWFTENFGEACKTIRIISDEAVRKQRGWVFTPGIDDAETECNLDDVETWDLRIENNTEDVEPLLQQIIALL